MKRSRHFRLTKMAAALAVAGLVAPAVALAAGNANCPGEDVAYNPGNGQDIVVPPGYRVEVFAKDLNFPTDIVFVGNKNNFKAYVLESGTGLPGRCNDRNGPGYAGKVGDNPFTPDIVVFDQDGNKIDGKLGKPAPGKTNTFQADGPAIGLAFEHDFQGGRLFATDSNQQLRSSHANNNSSRVVRVDLPSGSVAGVINGLPTGDHPTEQILVKDGWLYWSQGSATNSGVAGHDNGGGTNQHDIACQQITLSENTWNSGVDGHNTSGYSPHGMVRKGAVVRAFEDATSKGMCTGAILRAKISNPQGSIEPYAWGFRNPYGIRFSPANHPLKGEMMYSENGEDERGARPTNNAPDRLGIARQNADGTPEYHGWPDRFGFLDSTQAVFNPTGKGPADDNGAAVGGKPVLPVLAFFPQQPVVPLALEPSDVAAVGLDFVPNSFVGGVVKKNAVLVSREGDFGFSPSNGDPEAGHDVELVNFTSADPHELQLLRFAFNCSQADQGHKPDGTPTCATESDQAFAKGFRGINRPTTLRFGPDGAAYLVDYGAVRDLGQAGIDTAITNPADAPLVQIPGTGVIWKITRVGGDHDHDGDDN
jgi:glucose/arabinose dehydrogenase